MHLVATMHSFVRVCVICRVVAHLFDVDRVAQHSTAHAQHPLPFMCSSSTCAHKHGGPKPFLHDSELAGALKRCSSPILLAFAARTAMNASGASEPSCTVPANVTITAIHRLFHIYVVTAVHCYLTQSELHDRPQVLPASASDVL